MHLLESLVYGSKNIGFKAAILSKSPDSSQIFLIYCNNLWEAKKSMTPLGIFLIY